jgi:tRNA nucleotidyltransferase (CCA-adding enzyme)
VPALAGVGDVTLDTLDRLPRAGAGGRRLPQRTVTRLAALFVDLPAAQVRTSLQALRCSKHDVAWATGLAERWHAQRPAMERVLAAGAPSDAQVRRWLAALGRLQAGAFLRLAHARWCVLRTAGQAAPAAAEVRALHRRMDRALFSAPLEAADLAVGGEELRRLGIPAGPIYAKILHALLEQVLDDPARNTPEVLLAEVPRIVAALPEGAPTQTPYKREP